ncbi:hypothetical protein ACRARG_12785 [Pseudooceanicola sp. C21-150M6]|uniref:hypothetical protein n=1 Tax=Pseudooceanicola sp. C21-150M6 TaxID=3434355 RepID=UPI003D7F97CB
MSILDMLEDFAAPPISGDGSHVGSMDLEELKAENFEAGYKAGWADSVSNITEDRNVISAELSRNLNDLNFTYREAYNAILTSVSAVLQEFSVQILPEILNRSIGYHVLDELLKLAQKHSEQCVLICVSPADSFVVRQLIDDFSSMRVEVDEDDTLSEGQVTISLRQEERQIDLSGILQGFQDALAAIDDSCMKASVNG